MKYEIKLIKYPNLKQTSIISFFSVLLQNYILFETEYIYFIKYAIKI